MSSSEIRPEMNSGLYRIWTHDLCDSGVDYSSLHRFIYFTCNDQLPVGLLAQSVNHCISFTKVMGSKRVQTWIVFRSYFHCCLSSVHYCKDHYSYASIYVSSGSETDVQTVYWLKGKFSFWRMCEEYFV